MRHKRVESHGCGTDLPSYMESCILRCHTTPSDPSECSARSNRKSEGKIRTPAVPEEGRDFVAVFAGHESWTSSRVDNSGFCASKRVNHGLRIFCDPRPRLIGHCMCDLRSTAACLRRTSAGQLSSTHPLRHHLPGRCSLSPQKCRTPTFSKFKSGVAPGNTIPIWFVSCALGLVYYCSVLEVVVSPKVASANHQAASLCSLPPLPLIYGRSFQVRKKRWDALDVTSADLPSLPH